MNVIGAVIGSQYNATHFRLLALDSLDSCYRVKIIVASVTMRPVQTSVFWDTSGLNFW